MLFTVSQDQDGLAICPPLLTEQKVSGREGRPGRDVLPVPTGKRKIKSRHAFDIYEDQVEVLQKLSLEDRMRGGAGSMSAMVREAIDEYIAKYRAE